MGYEDYEFAEVSEYSSDFFSLDGFIHNAYMYVDAW